VVFRGSISVAWIGLTSVLGCRVARFHATRGGSSQCRSNVFLDAVGFLISEGYESGPTIEYLFISSEFLLSLTRWWWGVSSSRHSAFDPAAAAAAAMRRRERWKQESHIGEMWESLLVRIEYNGNVRALLLLLYAERVCTRGDSDACSVRYYL